MKSRKGPHILTRRSFLGRAACAGLGATAATHAIRDLRLINTALAADPPTDYKALVCVFLAGGNDANNWIVPTDSTTYAQYSAIRGNLALPQGSLLPLLQSVGGAAYQDADGHTLGFHPSCPELATLFAENKLAAVCNVGSLVRPITRAEYLANASGTRPPQLFSHSDQVTQWQTSLPDQPPSTGWAGRTADILHSISNPPGGLSMSVSLNGANTLEIGNLVAQYHVSTTGAVALSGDLMTGSGARVEALRQMLALDHANLQRTAYADVVENAIATGELLNTNIQSTAMATDTPPGTWVWNTPFPTSSLGNQLKMIARLIEARGPAKFNMKRQIFFCSTGGFDTHTSQVTLTPNLNPLTGTHANLLDDVSACIFAFQRAMEQLGVSNKVTTFTASDFSRTFPTNSQGSDHGWGSNCIIVGGGVNGGETYGHLPVFEINGPNDTSTGRWIPTLAVDQHSATLAKWFGLNTADIQTILPNIGRFSTADLGFMGPA
jgi:uncharacterized protein (DUF1501 family)